MKKTIVLALAAIMVLGVAGAAFADSVTYEGGSSGAPPVWSAAGTVNASAKVNPKITLTLGVTSDTDGDGVLELAWDITPGTAEPTPEIVNLTVDSNKDFTIERTADDSALSAAGISFDFTGSSLPTEGTKGGDFTCEDTVNLSSTNWWNVEPGDYSGSIVYTVTQ